MAEQNGAVLRAIAHIRTDFPSKFGIPRQSGVVAELPGLVVFEPEYSSPDALRGIEAFSHLWLIWGFSENVDAGWSPTVRPPRLGGNERRGVFATRSPFRPNGLGLSCVKLESVENGSLRVSGVDMLDATPIYDVKPYVPYCDCKPEATQGFTSARWERSLKVAIPAELAARLPEDKLAALTGVLANDPRPAYQDDPEREYGFGFAGAEIRFKVSEGVLTVTDVG